MAYESTVSVDFSSPHANMRGADDFNRAAQHSKLVAALRTILPLSALAIIVLFCGLAITTQLPDADVTVDAIGLKQGKLVMERPTMAGFDKNSRPYDVKALQAIQDLAQPGKVMLREIVAKLPVDSSSFANIEARSGVYDTSNEKLFLDKSVTITGARGMDLTLEDADFDIRSGTMASENPVTANSSSTKISAESVRVEENGNRILFNNRVKMTITRPTQRGIDTPVDEVSRQP
ncbi:MAG: LPS export ABC transporter periplasmic protein LptC [Rhizobiaceae bacterium]